MYEDIPENSSLSEKLPFFLRYLRPVAKLGALGLMLTVLLVGLKTLLPLSSKIFIDYIVLDKGPDAGAGIFAPLASVFTSLGVLLTALVFLALGIGALDSLLTYVMARFREEYTFSLRTDLFRHVIHFPYSYFRSHQTGYLMSRISNDVSMLQYIFSDFAPQLLSNTLYILFSVGILFALNTRLTIIIICIIPLFIIVNVVFVKRIRAVTFQEREREAYLSRDLQEVLSAIELVKSNVTEEREVEKVASTLRGMIEARIKNAVLSSFSSYMRLGIQFLITLAVFGVGGSDVLNGTMTIGDFVAYAAYVATFASAVNALFSFPIMLQPASVSAERILELFSNEPEWEYREEGEVFSGWPVQGDIRFEGVTFSYREGNPVLKNASLSARRGEVIGIVGRTGAGKTTLISLMLGYYTPQSGIITLDGHDISEVDPRWLRRHIALVSQDLFLFHDTVLNNIRYARPEATEAEVAEAAGKAGIHEEILTFNDGYRTVVGERGMQLSVGQRQRIAIARAFLKDAPILILDEPTSALDMETERSLQGVLKTLTSQRTTILVSHRPSLLEIADRIYSVDDCVLVSSETSEEV